MKFEIARGGSDGQSSATVVRTTCRQVLVGLQRALAPSYMGDAFSVVQTGNSYVSTVAVTRITRQPPAPVPGCLECAKKRPRDTKSAIWQDISREYMHSMVPRGVGDYRGQVYLQVSSLAPALNLNSVTDILLALPGVAL